MIIVSWMVATAIGRHRLQCTGEVKDIKIGYVSPTSCHINRADQIKLLVFNIISRCMENDQNWT